MTKFLLPRSSTRNTGHRFYHKRKDNKMLFYFDIETPKLWKLESSVLFPQAVLNERQILVAHPWSLNKSDFLVYTYGRTEQESTGYVYLMTSHNRETDLLFPVTFLSSHYHKILLTWNSMTEMSYLLNVANKCLAFPVIGQQKQSGILETVCFQLYWSNRNQPGVIGFRDHKNRSFSYSRIGYLGKYLLWASPNNEDLLSTNEWLNQWMTKCMNE